MATYDKGDGIRVSVTFTNNSGVVADPTTVLCKVLAPYGAITSLPHGPSAGYQGHVVVSLGGIWLRDRK